MFIINILQREITPQHQKHILNLKILILIKKSYNYDKPSNEAYQEFVYDLYSVTNHHGSIQHGHYTIRFKN